jgi:hypothetical protein
LNSSWISTYFQDYDGKAEFKADKVWVAPHWFINEPIETEKVFEVDYVKAKDNATLGGFSFGSSETAPWYVLAMVDS